MNIEDLNEVETYIENNKNKIMTKCSSILGRKIEHANFNGIVGGKNTSYNVRTEDYSTASKYVEAWFDSFEQLYQSEKDFERIPAFDSETRREKSVYRMKKLLNDKDVKKFVTVYLARTYLRKLNK
ncbi:hypothetical protein FOG26_05675 [Staphylococcus cohnii]|uniref:hypothetical protein n=1 Tax=Staphylococcus cohnii TaxID=29382 RepID=UPI001CC9257C|nr:hypothetical protein [Staphylococcus cohnii]MBZ8172659.1 hypothetical protein [Staphylococcus cohnii]